MARWSPWGATKKYRAKLRIIELHGFAISEAELVQNDEVAEEGEKQEETQSTTNKTMTVEVKWKGANKKSGIVVAFSARKPRNVSKESAIVRNGDPIVWEDEEFEHVCNFSIVPSSSKVDDVRGKSLFGPWMVSFHLLLGEKGEESKKKTRDVGKATVDLSELLRTSQLEDSDVNHHVPILYQFDGRPPTQATLSIAVSFREMREAHSRSISCDSVELMPSSDELRIRPQESLMMRARSFALSSKKKRATKSGENESTNSEESDSAWLDSSSGDKGLGFWIWRRKNKTSFKRAKTADPPRSQSISNEGEPSTSGSWETKELISRDTKTKLKAKVFFASYDQRSERAAGESACTAIVTMFAHWLHSNPNSMPSKPTFDHLIARGSSEWRALCNDKSLKSKFHDNHFDLDTVLDANIQPLAVIHARSRFGFFSPEKFAYLIEATSFDHIWDEIEEGVYIVCWNDHFFVLKVGSDSCYIMDSLGERLYERCDRAYILEFNDSAVMSRKVTERGDEEVICRGKECCREYMKRFLAAITVREMEEAERKGAVSTETLHRRLQIEFHYSSPSASASTSAAASPAQYQGDA